MKLFKKERILDIKLTKEELISRLKESPSDDFTIRILEDGNITGRLHNNFGWGMVILSKMKIVSSTNGTQLVLRNSFDGSTKFFHFLLYLGLWGIPLLKSIFDQFELFLLIPICMAPFLTMIFLLAFHTREILVEEHIKKILKR